jgi:peptidoglycan/xylan/chitin deacetylase (PgdA/CDA1 family)
MRNDLLVLCYHAISDRWPADLAVTRNQLHDQLELLVRRGYRGDTFARAVTQRRRGKVLAITFDDAYTSVLELARPVLASLDLPGTVFVVTDFAASGDPLAWPGIDQWRPTEHAGELSGLTWKQLAGLSELGWEIGSHTVTHPRLTRLDDRALERELRGSRQACEDALGGACRSIAYPYGDTNGRVVAATRAAGYTAGAALSRRLAPSDALRQPRIGVYRPDTLRRFELKVSPPLRRIRTAVDTASGRLRPPP